MIFFMSLDVGAVVVGKVAKITKFGAFIKLPDGNTGLCHISEISSNFVKEVSDVLGVDDEVSVKVLSIGDDGKISLSIKQAAPEKSNPSREKREFKKDFKKEFKKDFKKPSRDFSRKPVIEEKERPADFEELLSGYMKSSSEKLKNMKKVRSRKGNGYNR